MTKDLLLEIGTEEIPARFMPGAEEQLPGVTREALDELRLSHGDIEVFTTPRRLAVRIARVPEQAEDLLSEVKGPPAQTAFDEEGNPTQAAKGFARNQGVDVQDLETREISGGTYVVAVRRETGKPLPELAQPLLDRIVGNLSFPVAMRWGEGKYAFVRPVRWLVLLWGQEVLPAEVAGVKAGSHSRGHRYLGQNPVEIGEPGLYPEALEANYAVVRPEERRRRILEQADALAQQVQGRVQWDEELLTEVVHLVEYPTAFLGAFSPEYLDLPPATVVTPMKEHQRYFPVEDSQGELLPYFIGVRNGDERALEVVKSGNEKVLQARLQDARFFFREDRQHALMQRVESLNDVVFVKNLGTMHDKMLRLKQTATALAKVLEWGSQERQWLSRAAQLCKADLVTQMVFEFDELQGYMGREYARLDGEPEAVAQAIYEHYLPRFAGDDLPQSASGQLLSLVDKVDTLVGCFSQGIVPSGSTDPYALRRQGNGVARILLSEDAPYLSLSWLLERATQEWAQAGFLAGEDSPKVLQQVKEFLLGRARMVLEEQGFRGDLVEATMVVGDDRLWTLARKVESLQQAAREPWFEDLLTAQQRVHNLAGKAGTGATVSDELLQEEAEQKLYAAARAVQEQAEAARDQGRYRECLQLLSELKTPIDRFFDEVLVMAPQPELQANRLALLDLLDRLFTLVADLSRVNAQAA